MLALVGAALLAMMLANSPAAPEYFAALDVDALGLSIRHWINDGLMTIFFLLIGLEIKGELRWGQLSTWSARALPGIAALGGMVVPALIYVALNWRTPASLPGWGVPVATDIAFALGVLALLGSRAPPSLKIFLTALAILDDLGAITIIAIFYSADLSGVNILSATVIVLALVTANRRGARHLGLYLGLGAALWFFVLKSGVHATLAGIALAMLIPDAAPAKDDSSPSRRLEHALGPWVALLILPVFALANAGVSLEGLDRAALLAPVPLGIAAGLFLGKQVGVFGFAWLAIRAGWATRPVRASWLQLYGVAMLCGIGFTMSLFIGVLAFPGSPDRHDDLKIGVLVGSGLSALGGAALLFAAAARRPAR